TIRLASIPAVPTPDPMPESPPAAPEPNLRLRNAAIGTAASTLATAAVGLGLSLKARSLHDDYDRAADAYEMTGNEDDLANANRLANRTDRFNIAADVMWGTTVALGISAIVLYVKHRRRQRRERADVTVSVTRQGGYAAVRVPMGRAK
ncbi:MAG: hypothetical protein WBG86_10580, partial [Polyangiales bacterium]